MVTHELKILGLLGQSKPIIGLTGSYMSLYHFARSDRGSSWLPCLHGLPQHEGQSRQWRLHRLQHLPGQIDLPIVLDSILEQVLGSHGGTHLDE